MRATASSWPFSGAFRALWQLFRTCFTPILDEKYDEIWYVHVFPFKNSGVKRVLAVWRYVADSEELELLVYTAVRKRRRLRVPLGLMELETGDAAVWGHRMSSPWALN